MYLCMNVCVYICDTHCCCGFPSRAFQPRHTRLRQRIQTCELVGRASSINITDLLARSQHFIRPTKQHHFTIIIYIFYRKYELSKYHHFLVVLYLPVPCELSSQEASLCDNSTLQLYNLSNLSDTVILSLLKKATNTCPKPKSIGASIRKR